MSHLPGKFVWFEHCSTDVASARSFYAGLFGWNVEAVPIGDQQYPMIHNAGQGIGGFRAGERGTPSHWMTYVSVPDVDACVRAATGAGGKVLMPPTDFGPIGRGATIADPTGAALCPWHGTEGDRPDVERIAVGDWYWNECWTTDDRRALAFYEKVFGYSHESMDMGPQGTYYVLKSGGVPRAGLMKANQPGTPSAWMPYVSVANCDASATQAQSLGATLLVPPTDIPEVGRFGVLSDPLGAVIGIIRGGNTAA